MKSIFKNLFSIFETDSREKQIRMGFKIFNFSFKTAMFFDGFPGVCRTLSELQKSLKVEQTLIRSRVSQAVRRSAAKIMLAKSKVKTEQKKFFIQF